MHTFSRLSPPQNLDVVSGEKPNRWVIQVELGQRGSGTASPPASSATSRFTTAPLSCVSGPQPGTQREQKQRLDHFPSGDLGRVLKRIDRRVFASFLKTHKRHTQQTDRPAPRALHRAKDSHGRDQSTRSARARVSSLVRCSLIRLYPQVSPMRSRVRRHARS